MGSNGPVICDHTPGGGTGRSASGRGQRFIASSLGVVARVGSSPAGSRSSYRPVARRPRLPRARSYLLVVLGSACEAASWTSRSGTPASSAAVMKAWRRVRPDGLGDPCPAGDPAHDPPGTVPVQAAAVCGQEDRSVRAFRRWPGRSPGRSVAPAGWLRPCRPCGDHQGPVPALHAQRLDVSAGGFRVA